MKKSLIITIIFASIFSSCCNEKPIEIPEFEPPETDKIVLIEELTGVRCINCPDGATTIKGIETKYEGKVVSIAIHAGDLTEPLESSKYDLSCEDGINLEKSWSYLGKPAAAIDRVVFEEPDIPVSGYTAWEQYVEEELQKENILNLTLTTDYNTETRIIDLSVNIFPLKDITGNFKLNIAITESHIIDSQIKRDGSIDEEYEFENVLRDMITPFDGQSIGANLEKNSLISKTFSYTLPESDNLWKPENIKIIAFVTGGENSDLFPVINAAGNKIIE